MHLRCGCGRVSSAHSQLALSRFTTSVTRWSALLTRNHAASTNIGATVASTEAKWSTSAHTSASPTDAFGTLEFAGGMHAHKARYLRLAFDSSPLDVLALMERVWALERPRLVISVRGAMMHDFEVEEERLGRTFREGMLAAVETTGAWIITAGVDSGAFFSGG